MKYGIIAGNGRFPAIALETARKQGDEAIAIAIKEEASGEVDAFATRCYWVSLGELSKVIEICHNEGITQIMMAGPLYLLYEISVWIAWYWDQPDRAKARRALLRVLFILLLVAGLLWAGCQYGWPLLRRHLQA